MGAENAVSSQEGIVGVHCWSKDLETRLLYAAMVETQFNPTNQNLKHPVSTPALKVSKGMQQAVGPNPCLQWELWREDPVGHGP